MRKSLFRVLSVLLAVILAFGLLPAVSFAGGDPEPIREANVFVHYPMGGQAPNMQGTVVGSKDYTIDFVHFFDCYNGQPVGKFLEDTLFTAGRLYACQICLIPKEDYEFRSSSEVFINGRLAECDQIDSDGAAYYTVFFTAAAGTCTVTFDTCGRGTPHDPIQVPKNGTMADAVADVSQLDPKDRDYEDFVMWSLDPVALTYSYNAFAYTDQVTEDITLYAHWILCTDTVDLYVQVPPNCFTTNVQESIVTVPERADYSVDTDYFYLDVSTDDYGYYYLHYDLVWRQPFQKGVTYFSAATVYTHMAKEKPKVNVYGATVVATQRWDDDRLKVIFKMTIPSGSSLSSAAAYVETPQAGQSASSYKPKVTGLTPGLDMSIAGWYQNSSCSGSYYTGSFTAGSTYYAKLTIGGSNCKYSINANSLSLTLRGLNVKLVSKTNVSSNCVSAVVSVTIPKWFNVTAEPSNSNGKLRCTQDSPYWQDSMNMYLEAGSVTVEAKAKAGYQFKMWYNADTYEILSKNATYTFTLSKNVHLKASFVERPFLDVGAWDYYYEPVMWAINHEPQITAGTDSNHFGSNETCTRGQVMTFLYKALGEPLYLNGPNPFEDVKPNNYFYKPVMWAYRNGITSGVDATHFGPNLKCTRADVIYYLWASKGRPEPGSTTNPFQDVSPKNYFYKAVLWALEEGVTGGMEPNYFGAKEFCTRAQVITFLCKVYGPKG